MKWRRLGPGRYESQDGRSSITRIEGWEVAVEGSGLVQFVETLREAKLAAEEDG